MWGDARWTCLVFLPYATDRQESPQASDLVFAGLPWLWCLAESFFPRRVDLMKTSLFVFLAAIFTASFTAALGGPAGATPPVHPFESDAEVTPQNRIDELVFADLKRLNIPPARLCSDEVFVRRVYLDVIGTLPTPREAEDFLKETNPNKRRELIDRLLERDEFADYWAMKWCDLLRVKSEFPINLWPNAVQAYHRWIHTCLKENVPYDRFVREMLVGSGSNFRVPQVNFYRAVQSKEPQPIAQAVALSFMGVRPEGLPAERWPGMAVFFSQISFKPTVEWKEEIVSLDLEKSVAESAAKSLAAAVFPDGTPAHLTPGQDPRRAFADWLTAAEESLVRAERLQSRLVLVVGPGHHP